MQLHTGLFMQFSHFRTLKNERIDELNSDFILLEHVHSGAKLLHLKNDDPENVFCLSLATYPQASHGVAHILEHMVLCGSEKYPVNDPFFSMIRRSLNTFMNAFTGSDFTCYPAASQNKIDFYNLLDVYIDAVFFPKLDQRSFMQEGHRLQWSEPEKLKGLERAGIVYNEMKGVYGNPDTHLWRKLYEKLLSDTLYSLDSGGDPAFIPDLKWQDLKDFHALHYHPSRCLFYFYGNLDTLDHADFLHQRLLNDTAKQEPLPERIRQASWIEPLYLKDYFPASPTTDLSNREGPMAALSWLTCDIKNTHDLLILELLDYLLMGHDGAPLKQFLLQSGLCKQAYSHLDSEMLQVPYTLVLKDCSLDSAEDLSLKFEQLLTSKLREIHEEGFTHQAVASALHQLKLSRLEMTGSGYPFGLMLFFRAGLAMQQGCDPIDNLRLHSHLAKLKELVENPQSLMNAFQHYLLDNAHHLSLILEPDTQMAEKAQAQEKNLYQELELKLNLDEKKEIQTINDELDALQDQVSNLDCLPLIPISAIETSGFNYELNHFFPKVYSYTAFTNGFSYFDLSLTLPKDFCANLSLLNWHELKLLTYLWPRLGAGSRTYQEQLEQLDLCSGGLDCSLQLFNSIESTQGFKAELALSIFGLSEKKEEFLEIFKDSLFQARLDEKDRIKQLLLTLKTSLQSSLSSQALQYAVSASSSQFSPIAKLSNWLSGIDFFHFIKQESLSWQEGSENLIARLQVLKNKLFEMQPLARICLSTEAQQEMEAADLLDKILTPLKTDSNHDPYFNLEHDFPKPATGYSLNSQVNFNALSLPGPSLNDPDQMLVRIACELIKQTVLHQEIREKGGAYGYGCNWSAEKQTITFHSYRDPHITRTLDVFATSTHQISQGNFNDEQLDEAKRCIIQKLDKPVPPSERASLSDSWNQLGLSLSLRNQLRVQLLTATKTQVAQAAHKWFVETWENRQVCLFGSAQLIEQATGIKPQDP
jgi:Zn-dependent M16 (insulinase) family peptidase